MVTTPPTVARTSPNRPAEASPRPSRPRPGTTTKTGQASRPTSRSTACPSRTTRPSRTSSPPSAASPPRHRRLASSLSMVASSGHLSTAGMRLAADPDRINRPRGGDRRLLPLVGEIQSAGTGELRHGGVPRSVLVEVEQVAAGVGEDRVDAAVVHPTGFLNEHHAL